MRLKIIIFLLFIAVVGCENKLILGPEPPDSIMPLTVGNQWVYQYTAFDIVPPDTMFYDTVTFDVITALDNNFYTVEYSGVVDTFPNYSYFRSINGGLEQLDVNTQPFDTVLVFRFPVTLNQNYFLSTSVVTVEATDTMISVSGGSFPSVYYHIIQMDTSGTVVLYDGKIFYSLNVGQVKAEKYYYNFDGSFEYAIIEELLDYNIIIVRDSIVT
jgi:hypothetical protein